MDIRRRRKRVASSPGTVGTERMVAAGTVVGHQGTGRARGSATSDPEAHWIPEQDRPSQRRQGTDPRRA
jgi:hypothetical protein